MLVGPFWDYCIKEIAGVKSTIPEREGLHFCRWTLLFLRLGKNILVPLRPPSLSPSLEQNFVGRHDPPNLSSLAPNPLEHSRLSEQGGICQRFRPSGPRKS